MITNEPSLRDHFAHSPGPPPEMPRSWKSLDDHLTGPLYLGTAPHTSENHNPHRNIVEAQAATNLSGLDRHSIFCYPVVEFGLVRSVVICGMIAVAQPFPCVDALILVSCFHVVFTIISRRCLYFLPICIGLGLRRWRLDTRHSKLGG